jgi:hypothetical protein
MEFNPYAPPETETSALKNEPELAEEGYFFEVAVWKLILMNVCSLGLYQVYWFYRQWKAMKPRELAMIRPFWRAFFAVFFCYSCFSNIKDGLGDEEAKGKSPGLLAIGFVLFSLSSRMPDPYWLFSVFSFLFLIPVQGWATRVNAEKSPGRDLNNRLTWKNWILIFVGGLFTFMVMMVTLFPDLFPEE